MMREEITVPKNQIWWETHLKSDGTVEYIVTSDAFKQKWFRYDVVGKKLVKTGEGQNPVEARTK